MFFLKGVFQSEQPKQQMVTIVVDQYLISSAMYEHRCLEDIKKLYKSVGKSEYQQQYKAILGEDIVSTPEGFTDNSTM